MARYQKRDLDIDKINKLFESGLSNDIIAKRVNRSVQRINQLRKIKYVANHLKYKEIIEAANKIERSKQIIKAQYYDLISRCIITELEGPQDTPYRGVPLGWRDER